MEAAELAALEVAYEEAMQVHTSLQQRLERVRVVGNSVQYDAALHAVAEGYIALETARRAIQKYHAGK